MQKVMYVSLFFVLTLLIGVVQAEDKLQELQDVSVTIKTNNGQGSGVLFTREHNGHNHTFVWTAGHVVSSLRNVRTYVDTASGMEKKIIEFEDAKIVREFNQNGRKIGEITLDAKVIKYSDSENGEDIALLQIRQTDYTKASVKFYLDDGIPPIGTELYHVGSLYGQVGANSLTSGIVSQIGRVLSFGANSVIFDQTTATAFPGSSGGGVFFKTDNRYIGMLVRGHGEQFNLIVPVRRMKEWAKKVNILWAMDQNVEFPSDENLKNIPIEGSAVQSVSTDKPVPQPAPSKPE